MAIRKFCPLLLFLMMAGANLFSMGEIRKVTPPNLDQYKLGKEIVCHRPIREGRPKMDLKREGGKLLINNYGHGGSGFTLAPGAAQYIVDLLENEHPQKDEPIAIIGAGIIGLFSAFELYERGFTNITIYAKEFENLTSHNAGGLLAPVCMPQEGSIKTLIDSIGVNAYKVYAQIAKGQNSRIASGATIVPTYFRTREESGLEPYVTQKVMNQAKDVTVDFGNGTMRKMVVYDDGIFIDTGALMTSLTTYLQDKIVMKQQNIEKINSLQEQIVINCTGLGAKELLSDSKMVSGQGHLIMLKDQEPTKLQYMMLTYFADEKTQDGLCNTPMFYYFPKKLEGSGPNDLGVIGGTCIKGAGPSNPHKEQFKIMLERARKFFDDSYHEEGTL